MAKGHVARQVFDLLETAPPIVTEHPPMTAAAPVAAPKTLAAFPEGVTVGAVRQTDLLHYQLLPEKRLAALMADLFGVKLVTGQGSPRLSGDFDVRFPWAEGLIRCGERVTFHPCWTSSAGFLKVTIASA